MTRTPVGTALAIAAEVWHGLVACLDRASGWFPRRWSR
jgi:hypothetical protein